MGKSQTPTSDLVQQCCLIFTTIAALGGTTLLGFAIAGYPVFFESLMAYIAGFILYGIYTILENFKTLTSVIVQYIGITKGILETIKANQDNPPKPPPPKQQPPPPITSIFFSDNMDMSEEDLENMKSSIPEYLHSMLDIMGMGGKKGTDIGGGDFTAAEKPLSEMTLNELYIVQKQAVDSDDYEKAARIKKEIESRK